MNADWLSSAATRSSYPKNAKATEHLWVIVTEVDAAIKKAICVNVTTLQSHSDTTCILKPGDHRFVRHESVINFSDAREMAIDLVEQALQARIDSRQTPRGIKASCKKLWGLE